MVACVKLSEIWNFLKVKWEGIKGLPQTFIFAFMISVNSNPFQIQNPREKMIWLLPFKLNERVFENNWMSFGNISIHKLHAAQWFSWEKIKWLLQIIWNMSWEFQTIKFKVLLNLFSIWSYLSFIQIIFLQKQNTWKIG